MEYLQLIYISRAAPNLAEDEVFEILRTSQDRNQVRRISGMLLYRDRRFVQLLEGPAEAVHTLYHTIEADPRHDHIELLGEFPAKQLLMPTWAMGYLPPSGGVATRSGAGFVLSEEAVREIAEALPAAIGQPFLKQLGAPAK